MPESEATDVQMPSVDEIAEAVVRAEPDATDALREELLDFEEPVVQTPVQEQPVQEEQATEEPQGQFRNDQFATGQAMGLTPDQVRGFGDPAAFDNVAANWANTMAQAGLQSQQVQGQVQQAQQHITQEQQMQGVQTAFEFDAPDDYDPEIVEMNKFYGDKMQGMENMLNSVLMHTQRLQMEAAGREMDMILNSMDEEMYGRGRLNEIPESQALNRIAVADEVARVGHGYLSRGEGIPSLDTLVGRASQAAHGKDLSNKALQRVSDKAGEVARQATALPQHRDDSPSKGYEAAVRAAAEWQSEHSMPPE